MNQVKYVLIFSCLQFYYAWIWIFYRSSPWKCPKFFWKEKGTPKKCVLSARWDPAHRYVLHASAANVNKHQPPIHDDPRVTPSSLNIIIKRLTPGCPSSSFHAENVSWMYHSEKKHENYENQLTNGFVINLETNTKIIKNTIFEHKKKFKITKARSFLPDHDHFILHDFFLQKVSRVMRHTKIPKFNGKKVVKITKLLF